MKTIIRQLAFYASLALLAVTAFANTTAIHAQTSPAPAAQNQCSDEKKLAWYNEFRQTFKTDQAKAYDVAKKYLACPTAASEQQIADYLKNFVTLYEKQNRKDQVTALVYDKKDYAKAFDLGRQILATEPDNIRVLIDLSYAGFLALTSKVPTYNTDTLNYSKKAIQLIQSGTAPDAWTPYSGKDEALAYLNNTIGQLLFQQNPAEALPYLIQAAQLEGKLKKQAITYGYIGDAYQVGLYEKLSADYKAKFEGKDETPESKLALENINQVVDRIIDAYARAVALAGNDPATQASKKVWMESLTGLYKYRHNQSETGLPELIASVTSKPLPPLPTRITALPASTPSSTTPNSGNPGMSTVPAGSTAAPAAKTTVSTTVTPGGTKSTTTTTATTTATTKPATTAKPKPRNNHRRH